MKHMTLPGSIDMPYPTWLPCHVAWDETIMSGTWHLRPCSLEHGEVKGSHMTLNVQHENTIKLI